LNEWWECETMAAPRPAGGLPVVFLVPPYLYYGIFFPPPPPPPPPFSYPLPPNTPTWPHL